MMGAKSHCGQVTFGNGRRYWDKKMLTKIKELKRSRMKLNELMLRGIETMVINFRQL